MAPNQNLLIDSSTFGDNLHRDLYIREKFQSSTGDITNEFFKITNGVATAIAAEQIKALGSSETQYSLFTKSESASAVTPLSDTPMVLVTQNETDLNSKLVKFSGLDGIRITSPSASLQNAGTSAFTGAASFANSVQLTNATSSLSVAGSTDLQGVLTSHSNVSFVSTTATFQNAGTTTLQGAATLQSDVTLDNALSTLSVAGASHLQGVLTADSNVTFSGTSAEFTVEGTTTLKKAATLNSSLSVLGSSDLQGVVTAHSDVSLVGTTSTFTNEGLSTFVKDITAQSNLTLDNASSTLQVAGTSDLLGVLTSHSNVSFVGSTSNFTNEGTTTLVKDVTLNNNLSLTNASSTLSIAGGLDVTGITTAHSDVNLVGTSSTLTNSGLTTLVGTASLQNQLNVLGATTLYDTLTVSSAVSFIGTGTSSQFTVEGPSVFNGSVTINGSLGQTGDLDMNNYNILNLQEASRGDSLRLQFDNTATNLNAFVGTGTNPIFQVTPTGVNIRGDVQVIGSSTGFTIESSTVAVQDLNISLGYAAPTLADCHGAGFTIGKTGSGYTLPAFEYQYAKNAFVPNIALRSDATDESSFSRLSNGIVDVFNWAGTKSSALEFNSLRFNNAWRLYFDETNDQLKIERNDGSSWVTKFVFTA